VSPFKVTIMPLYVERSWNSDRGVSHTNHNALSHAKHYTAEVVSRAKDGGSITVYCAESCGRCNGTGIVWALHVDKGMCWNCNGESVVWKNRKLYTRGKIAKMNAIAESKRIKKQQARDTKAAAAVEANAKLFDADVMTGVLAWREKMLTDAGFYVEFNHDDQAAQCDWYQWQQKHDDMLEADVVGEDKNYYQARRNSTIHSMSCDISVRHMTQRAVDYLTVLWVAKQGEASRQAAADAAKVEVPEGKQTVAGIIKSIKISDGHYGTERKMLLECDGFNLWGSIPKGLLDGCDYKTDDLKGAKVQFSATVEAKELGFGFYKRPTKPILCEV
jgi:hypothetical protein